jgi:hypothetical protein
MTPTPTQIAQWRKEFELAELAWLEDDLPSVKRDLLERKDDKYIHAMMRIKWNVCLATNLRAKAEQATELGQRLRELQEELDGYCPRPANGQTDHSSAGCIKRGECGCDIRCRVKEA